MSSINKASLDEEGSSKWSNIKDFYENFKDELSGSDFNDFEEEDASETYEYITQEEYDAEAWQSLGTEIVWVEDFQEDEEVVIIEDSELEDDVLETTTKSITRNPCLRKNQVSEVSSTPKRSKSSSKVLNVRNKATPARKIKKEDIFEFVYPSPKPVPMPEYTYNCPKCHKGSNKPNFLDSHTEAQCERAQSTRDRQSTVKKTFTY
jgi:hypothetical protein